MKKVLLKRGGSKSGSVKIIFLNFKDSDFNTYYYSKKWNQTLGPYLDCGKRVKLYGKDLKLCWFERVNKQEKKINE